MIRKTIAMIGATAVAMLGLAAQASADVQAGPDCQNGDGYQTVVTKGVVRNSDGSRAGIVEVCREDSLYFGFVLFDAPMTASQYANVDLLRYDNGAPAGSVTCNDPGGNGTVLPGQRRCWTANLNGAAVRYKFQAMSFQYSSHTGDLISMGNTPQVR